MILAGGAINSPQLLLLSGVGPADELRRHGIEVVADLPGVGANLQDHLEIYVQHACTRPITLYSALQPLGMMKAGLSWYLFRGGAGASNQFEAGGFIRSRAGVEHPDLQYHFIPIAMRYDGSGLRGQHGFQAHVGPMRPESRGRVRLRSADPRAAPSIVFNYLSAERDRRELRDSVRLTRELFAQRAFDPWRGAELAPGAEVRADDALDAFVRQNVESAFHPCGTCRMGTDKGRGDGRGDPGARHGGPPGGGRLHHAHDRVGQPQRPHPDARGEGGGSHPRPSAPAPVQRPGLDRPGLADRAALSARPATTDAATAMETRMTETMLPSRATPLAGRIRTPARFPRRRTVRPVPTAAGAAPRASGARTESGSAGSGASP